MCILRLSSQKALLEVLSVVFLLFSGYSISFAQVTSSRPTVYPYGGHFTTSPKCQNKKVLSFTGKADWSFCTFESEADFAGSIFHEDVNLNNAVFKKIVFFGDIIICSTFSDTTLSTEAKTIGAVFNQDAFFNYVTFEQDVLFTDTEFHGTALFNGCSFLGEVSFYNATFFKQTNFTRIDFTKGINFKGARIFNDMYFSSVKSDFQLDFLKVGLLGDNVKIYLGSPIFLRMQIEKFKNLALVDSLDYYSKKEIISFVKSNSFDGEANTRERFELDYLLARSTKYQEISTEYKLFKWYEFWKTLPRYLYDEMMGLGYRPFRILYWMFGFLIIFSFILFFTIRESINAYINRNKKKPELKSETYFSSLVNCFYVTAGAFFGIRLNQDILTFFKPKERWKIILIYSVGLFMYFLFIYGAKTGAILGALKTLFA